MVLWVKGWGLDQAGSGDGEEGQDRGKAKSLTPRLLAEQLGGWCARTGVATARREKCLFILTC